MAAAPAMVAQPAAALVTALKMWGIKGVKQSSSQWNILSLVMLSMCVYMIGGSSDSGSGVVNVLLKVTISCFCAVLLGEYMKVFQSEPIYMQLGQFQCAWCATILAPSFVDSKTWQNGVFTGWSATTVGVLASFTVKGWSTMYLLATMGSVLRYISEAMSMVVIYFLQVFLPVFEDAFEVPKFLTVMVVILSVNAYVCSFRCLLGPRRGTASPTGRARLQVEPRGAPCAPGPGAPAPARAPAFLRIGRFLCVREALTPPHARAPPPSGPRALSALPPRPSGQVGR